MQIVSDVFWNNNCLHIHFVWTQKSRHAIRVKPFETKQTVSNSCVVLVLIEIRSIWFHTISPHEQVWLCNMAAINCLKQEANNFQWEVTLLTTVPICVVFYFKILRNSCYVYLERGWSSYTIINFGAKKNPTKNQWDRLRRIIMKSIINNNMYTYTNIH